VNPDFANYPAARWSSMVCVNPALFQARIARPSRHPIFNFRFARKTNSAREVRMIHSEKVGGA